MIKLSFASLPNHESNKTPYLRYQTYSSPVSPRLLGNQFDGEPPVITGAADRKGIRICPARSEKLSDFVWLTKQHTEERTH